MSGVSRTDAVLAYDGDCTFCQGAIGRIHRRAAPRIQVVPWQSLPQCFTARHAAQLNREVMLFREAEVLAGGADALACCGSAST